MPSRQVELWRSGNPMPNHRFNSVPTSFKCAVGGEWAPSDNFSKSQLSKWTKKKKSPNDGVTPENIGLICKDHPQGPTPEREIKCNGPCGTWKQQKYFSKIQRNSTAAWCSICTAWKDQFGGSEIPATVPGVQMSFDEIVTQTTSRGKTTGDDSQANEDDPTETFSTSAPTECQEQGPNDTASIARSYPSREEKGQCENQKVDELEDTHDQGLLYSACRTDMSTHEDQPQDGNGMSPLRGSAVNQTTPAGSPKVSDAMETSTLKDDHLPEMSTLKNDDHLPEITASSGTNGFSCGYDAFSPYGFYGSKGKRTGSTTAARYSEANFYHGAEFFRPDSRRVFVAPPMSACHHAGNANAYGDDESPDES
ncbi:hypothetical protein GGS23DRAFT_610560 [Durotheca rogersii]|uniref:uncharacterized protein n=1 Tax=Durotheca rogersii TaxID=419775 RepID=UPI0022205830|nr:uncharacterized protein GGS23DRAFT_610560 [Durotheca rogersii]KAI5862376.1 hypothetical protein GGS23DRAFT_610560 [Durotheca rogersii]